MWLRPSGLISSSSFPMETIEKFGLLLGWGVDRCCELPLKVVAEIARLLPLVGNVRLPILSLNVVREGSQKNNRKKYGLLPAPLAPPVWSFFTNKK